MAMEYIQKIGDLTARMEFVENLKDITEKKIYLEVEYARCCMILVKHNEKNADKLRDAALIMENVQVETYGSMSQKEKLEFLLYQMKLNLLLGDFTKLYIVGKKINPKTLDKEGFEYEKLSFNLYSYYFQQNNGDYKELVNCLINAYAAMKVMDFKIDHSQLDKVLIERFSDLLDKNNMTQALLSFKCLEELSETKQAEMTDLVKEHEVYVLYDKTLANLLTAFTNKEVFSCNVSVYNLDQLFVFKEGYLNASKFRTELEVQLVKKNLYMVSKYYKTVRMQKLAVLFDNSMGFIEDQLCKLIQDGLFKAKVDRMDMVIDFGTRVNEAETIDSWVDNINGILDLVNFVSERIEREEVKA
jgi:26S proteasome regulatory subunit N5